MARVLGIVSDTHGLIRPDALTALDGCEHILHAGDIGSPSVLDALSSIAPVTAIRGNIDRSPWSLELKERARVHWAGLEIDLLHNLSTWECNTASLPDLIVAGHSHRPYWGYHHGVRHLNPGSIGPKRFSLPVSLARLHVHQSDVSLEQLVLDDRGRTVDWGPGCDDWPGFT